MKVLQTSTDPEELARGCLQFISRICEPEQPGGGFVIYCDFNELGLRFIMNANLADILKFQHLLLVSFLLYVSKLVID